MTKYRGIDQYIKFNYSHGAALDQTTYVMGGEMRDDSEVLEVRPLGDWRPRIFAPLGIRSDGSINFIPFERGILHMANRNSTTGDLTSFDIEGGVDGATPSILHEHCKVDTLTLECAANAPLVATLGWKAKYRNDGSASAEAYPGGVYADRPKSLLWSQCTVTSASAEVTNLVGDITGCTISVNHNVDWEWTLGAAGDDASRDRAAKYLRSHQQVVTVDIRAYLKDTYELQSDVPDTIDDLILVYANGTYTIRISATDLIRGTYTLPNVPNDDMVLGHRYQAMDFFITTA